MGKKVTNVNHGTVGKQDNSKDDKDSKGKGTVNNVNHGTVGIQAPNVDNESVVIVNGKRVR